MTRLQDASTDRTTPRRENEGFVVDGTEADAGNDDDDDKDDVSVAGWKVILEVDVDDGWGGLVVAIVATITSVGGMTDRAIMTLESSFIGLTVAASLVGDRCGLDWVVGAWVVKDGGDDGFRRPLA